MIVRIAGEGQFEVDQALTAQLNDFDNKIVALVEKRDSGQFTTTLGQMLALVRLKGKKLADEDLASSDLVLPPSDITLAEAQSLFTGEGLIPG